MSRSIVLSTVFFLALPGSVFAPEIRPPIVGLYSVTLKVSNQSKSNQFYQDQLKLPRAHNCLTPASTCFMASPFQRIETLGNGASAANMIRAVAFSTSNARLLRTYLLSQGLQPAKLISDPCAIQEFFEIADPEQHRLIFVTNNWAAPAGAQDAQLTDRMIHAGFIVRDRAATEHFYKDILGFRPYWHGGMKEDQTDWVSMQVPDGTDWLEFMVNVDANPDQRLRGIMNHIAIGVTDIHETEKRLRAAGAQVNEEPKIGRDGKWQLNVYDPDLTRVEFMEFKPVQKPCCSDFTGPHPQP